MALDTLKAMIGIQPKAKKPEAGGAKQPTTSDDLRQINRFVAPVVGGALAAACWVGWQANSVGPVLLWVFASVAAGGAAGFLFGIPRSGLTGKANTPPTKSGSSGDGLSGTDDNNAAAATRHADPPDTSTQARPNTNLEEISDWLTKIIVGLTLVNLKVLKDEVQRVCENAAASIRTNPTPSDISAATALVVGFALLGFLGVYLYMRLFVQGAIIRSDGQLNAYHKAVDYAERVARADVPLPQGPGAGAANPEPVVPSAASVRAAQAVADAAPSDPVVVLQPLRQLAGEYEALRGRKDYSKERTQMMVDIVRRMRPHAIAAAPYIEELMDSPSTGEHLAATVILQMKYMPEHMAWLARRLVEERSFIGYQAASALLARVRVAGRPESEALREAVRKAKEDRASHANSEPSLDNLINQILVQQ